MKKILIIPIILGSLFVVLLASVFAIKWPSLVEKYSVRNANQTGEVDTSNWLTYRDQELGISFRYPGSLIADRTGSSVLLWDDSYNKKYRSCSMKCEPRASIHVDSPAIDGGMIDYIANNTNNQIKNLKLLKLSNGNEAYYAMDGGGYQNPQILFIKNANHLAIITSQPSQMDYPTLKSIGESVELTGTSMIRNTDWLEYSNPAMGVSFSYPSDWLLVPYDQYSLNLIEPNKRLQNDRWGAAAMGIRVSSKEVDNVEPINDLRTYLEKMYEWDISNLGIKIETFKSDSGTQIYWLNGLSGEEASDAYYAKLGDGFVTFGNTSTRDQHLADTFHKIVSSFQLTQDINQVGEVDMSGWVPFDKTIHGFPVKFDYPKDWQVINLPDAKAGIALRSPKFVPVSLGGNVKSSGEIYITTVENEMNLSAEKLISTFSDRSTLWLDSYPYKETSVNGSRTIVFLPFREASDLPFRSEVFIEKGGFVVVVSSIYVATSTTTDDVFKSILNSLE